MLKTSLIFKKLHGQTTGEFLELRMRNFQGIVFYEHKIIGRFSNLHWCTFKTKTISNFAEKFVEKSSRLLLENHPA